jgi:ABC-type lipoprotein export system ATPase subunit
MGSYLFIAIVLNSVIPNGPESTYYALLLLASLLGFALSHLFTELSRSMIMAFLSFTMAGALQILFCGFFMAKSRIPECLRWLCNCSFMYWVVGQLVYNSWYGYKGQQGMIVLLFYGYDGMEEAQTYKALFIYVLVLECLVLLVTLPALLNGLERISADETEMLLKYTEHQHIQVPSPFLMQIPRLNSAGSSIVTMDIEKGTVVSQQRKSERSNRSNPLLEVLHTNQDDASVDRPMRLMSGSSVQVRSLHSSSMATTIVHSTAMNVKKITSAISETIIPEYDRQSSEAMSLSQSERESITADELKYDPLDESRRVTLSFENVSYEITSPSGEKKFLLEDVSAVAHPGELCAIMGPSGSGKTTLLNVLSGRVSLGVVSGKISVNGQPFRGILKGNSNPDKSAPTYGYVMQDDAHSPVLTVKETLQYAAMLRLGRTSAADVESCVCDTMRLLGITHIENNRVGSAEKRTISRGQIRRLTIGIEIVNSASLVFLDEPVRATSTYY